MTDAEAEDAILANRLDVVYYVVGPFHHTYRCTGRVDGCKLSVFGYTRNSVVEDWVRASSQDYSELESVARTLRRKL